PTLRMAGASSYLTDNGNHILDLATGAIEDPHALAERLDATVGVVEHGLFLDMTDLCLVADQEGVRERDA
ncbi:MAG: ribose-5-phosphate isomerase A, partial [Candidatus Thermoplasmatota archaeon]|nr:ribose-5-phosphate isomerase A [Candidatus Thermoplasmatota archaeon]